MSETEPTEPRPAALSPRRFLQWNSLTTRVTMFSLALFVAGIWSLTAYVSHSLRERMQHILSAQQFSTVSLLARQLDRELRDRLKVAENSAIIVARDALPNTKAFQEELLLRRSPVFSIVFNAGGYAISPQGEVILDTVPNSPRLGLQLRNKPHVAAALRGAPAQIVPPHVAAPGQSPQLEFIAPIYDANHVVRGAAVGVVDLGMPNFINEVTDSDYGQTGAYLLVAPAQRLIITGKHKQRVMEPLPPPGVNRTIDRFVAGYEGSAVFVNSQGKEVLTSGKRLPSANWLLVSSLPTAEAFAPIHDFERRSLCAAVLLTLLASVISWWVLRRQFKPLVDTAHELSRLSLSENVPSRLPIVRDDEVGALIGGFNHLLKNVAHAEAALRKSEERYRHIVETADEGVWMIDAQAITSFVNPKMARMLGYSTDEMLGKSLFDFMDEEGRRLTEHNIQRRQEGVAEQHDFKLQRKDGSDLWCLMASSPVFDAQQDYAGALAMVTDISARKRLEQVSAAERDILEFFANGRPLVDALHYLVSAYEQLFKGMHGSILLLDDKGCHLRHAAAPSLPAGFCAAVDGARIGPAVGSCGTAAYTQQLVVVADIEKDPLWADYRALALAHGLRACWSVPIMGTAGRVLGTLAFYYEQPRVARDEEIAIARRGAYLASLAIERGQAEALLRESAAHTQTILDNMLDGVITINEQGIVQSFNKSASTIFGYAADEIVGQSINRLMPESIAREHDGYLQRYQDDGKTRVIGNSRELEGVRKDGSLFPMSLSVSKVLRGGNGVFIGLVRDITQHRLDVEEIRRLAFYDPLTGLPNRRLLFDRLSQALITATRNKQHGALMLLDLDHFKQLNDSMGHDLGDLLLQQVATRLQNSVREGDSVARLGGDEFVVLLEALSVDSNEAAMQAELIAYKILAALGRTYKLKDQPYVSTPSIGIVLFNDDTESIDELLKKADVAMYQSKAAGRNTARFFDPAMQAAVRAHIELGKDMQRALAAHEFVLHYQIQVDSQGLTTGVEALVRWQHPERGTVPPAKFIPLAEENDLILPLGRWVLESACSQLESWAHMPKTSQWTMAVNVSAHQLAQPSFVSTVSEVLARTGANPCLLKLELTESMLAADVGSVIEKMNAIRALGVRFALDDFGTGYSSLSYLKSLPLDQLKIDQSFVRDLLSDPNDAVIAKTIVALGQSLGLSVIAEGVESQGQRDFLASIGCDAYQGFYFGRPLPAGALLQTLEGTAPGE